MKTAMGFGIGFERWGSRSRMLRGLRQLETNELVRIVR